MVLKGEVQKWVRWRFSNLIILRDRRELIIRLDKVHYFTRGSVVGLRKIGPETAKISRNLHPNKARGSPRLSRTNVTAAQIYQRTLSHRDWPASLSRPVRWCPGGLNYLSHRSSGPQYELICIQPIRDRAYSFAYSQSTAGDSTLGIY